MNDKARQLFEYLLAVNNLRFNVIRDYTEYDKSWNKQSLEEYGEDVFLFGKGKDEEAVLEIHRQKLTTDVLTPPQPDKKIKEWITYSYNKESQQPKVPDPKVVIKDNEKVQVNFEDDTSRVKLFSEWKNEWYKWAEEVTRMKKVQSLYELFFRIHQDFQKEGEGLELLLGETLFTWKHEVGTINHPLFTTKLDIELDTDKGVITVKPTNQGYKLELNILSGISLPNMEGIQNIGRLARYKDVLEEDVKDLSSQFMQLVDAGGRTSDKGETLLPSKNAVGHLEEFVILLRKKDNQVLKNDLEQIIDLMQEEDYPVPATIDSIVGNKINEETIHNLKWDEVGTDLYFPLAANEEQKDIARRLATNYGLTVQGPPGTGKTHTIANIVSHLLAHGKKVLITSQKENPLKVLKNKIPEEIRDLCVPVLGGGRDSLREIEKSIRTISEKLGNASTEKLKAEIAQSKEELDKSRRKEAKLKNQLLEYSKSERTEIEYKGNVMTKADAAKMLFEESLDYKWILDKIQLNANLPISEEEFQSLWILRARLKKENLNLKEYILPETDFLKSPEEMKKWLNLGRDLKHKNDIAIVHTDKVRFPIEKEYAQMLKEQLLAILAHKVFLAEDSASHKILDDILAGETRKERWVTFLNEMKTTNLEMASINSSIISYDIQLPNKTDFELEADIHVLGERLRQNKKPNAVFGLTKGKNARYLWQTPTINGQPVRNIEEIEVLQQHLLLKKKKQNAVRTWNANLDEVSGEFIEYEDKRLISSIDKKIDEFENIISFADKIEKFMDTVNRLNLRNKNWLSYDFYKELYNITEFVFDVLNYNEWKLDYSLYEEKLANAHKEQNMHPIMKTLLQVLNEEDENRWASILTELSTLRSTKEEVLEFYNLLSRLEQQAPQTASMIIDLMGNEIEMPKNPSKAWELKSLYNWMTENQEFEIERMEGNIKTEQEYQKKLIISIVSNSTWLNQINRITETQKRALVAWKNFIKRYGKGTGNNKRYLTDARQEMEKAQSAIPVWIMPVNQVIENFPVYNEKFDVIIFDESSQCDIMSVPVLLRGEKIVVVGDDEQISPYGIGTKDSEIEELIQRYLEGVPNKRLFDHKISLYEIADQIFPKSGRLMLKEHFRCVPEIIQFSNDLSYGGQMVPLRLPFENEKIDPPVLAIKVEEGYASEGTNFVNMPEAEKIVEDIETIIDDPKYNDQTIGVITLQGTKQAAHIENRIREKISESEFVKRKIICGNAYSLQGDERDIVFLSMVVAGNRRFVAMTKKDQQQTFNVAASRAKNQMRLYHSVELDDLKKDCYRYKLLSYCKNPTRVNDIIENLEEQCDSPFEVDVLRMIVAKGYNIKPQVKVGKFRIDFVIEGIRDRLAIECDGERWHGPEKWEEDMQRQYDLERAGWKFWRVRGRQFYYDRVSAMESLWEKLEELGIEPNLIDHSEEQLVKKEKIPKNERLNLKARHTPVTREERIIQYVSTPNGQIKFDLSGHTEPSKGSFEQIALLEEDNKITVADYQPSSFSLLNFLKERKLRVIDQREKGGNLWVVGGEELDTLMEILDKKGVKFNFTQKGSKSTNYLPGWYSSYRD
ncbi:AAA domain-containing protein [Sutcliffiella horikoshii]|uniref:AAA family ATPase n=1 Tax=Sutcliffiella horikoshii TaxID=79883 RepID=A0A5D4T7P0_9BACI|nr:AAA domain-containing protein [Sutcliffiella horikoshii]TYS71737.1 AAA family ATPase [Sutcliffiella horikoshii]